MSDRLIFPWQHSFGTTAITDQLLGGGADGAIMLRSVVVYPWEGPVLGRERHEVEGIMVLRVEAWRAPGSHFRPDPSRMGGGQQMGPLQIEVRDGDAEINLLGHGMSDDGMHSSGAVFGEIPQTDDVVLTVRYDLAGLAIGVELDGEAIRNAAR